MNYRSELLYELQAIVRHLRKSHERQTVRFRMADFASFALRVGTLWDCTQQVESIFAKVEEEQSEVIFEEDPICQALELWLETPQNRGRQVDSATLQRELSSLAANGGIGWPYTSPHSLAQRLRHLLPNLRQKFDVDVREDSSAHKNHYSFRPLVPKDRLAAEAQSVCLPEAFVGAN